MILSEVLSGIRTLSSSGALDLVVDLITCDSRAVRQGALFCALPGVSFDGHGFIDDAVRAGASAVLLENRELAPRGVPWVQVEDGRKAMALAASKLYGEPTALLPLIGITGTNGKTTTTYILEAILGASGLPAAVLGTISYRFGDTRVEASHTTPESTELQAAFRKLADAGARSFVMEVSSHALEQKRVDGCHFDVGVFSNLTRDHLDYHGTMEQYFRAKSRLFGELLAPTETKPRKRAVINTDDSYGQAMAASASCPVVTYGLSGNPDITAENISSTVNGISADLIMPHGKIRFASRLLGHFNLSNILAAAAAGYAMELAPDAIRHGIENHSVVPGRLERVDNGAGVTCLVDYAHTGDALENVLSTLKLIASARIITVFGCGGDRDSGKRPIMGKIAADYSDIAIATSDNPRTENPGSILLQVREGMIQSGVDEVAGDSLFKESGGKAFTIIEDRRRAIRLAVAIARRGDILLIAGKGHEDYQIIGNRKFHFDDREEASAAFKEIE